MPAIRHEISIDRSPEAVWGVLGDFTNVDWVPGVSAAKLEGSRRVCTLPEGGEIHEELVRNDAERTFSYVQSVHPLGLRRSQGTLSVAPDEVGARVVWEAEVEFADDAQEAQFLPMLDQGYEGALNALKQHLERS